MNQDIDPLLLSVAEAVADGFEVDWATLCERAPHIAQELARMRSVAEVGGAYRQIRERGDEPEGRPC
jgi:hypothetical protein